MIALLLLPTKVLKFRMTSKAWIPSYEGRIRTSRGKKESLLGAVVFFSLDTDEPAFLDVTRAARVAAERKSFSKVLADDADELEIAERGIGAHEELPTGVPDWPPRPFLARQRVTPDPGRSTYCACERLYVESTMREWLRWTASPYSVHQT